MEARAKVLREQIAAYRCYLEAATDINVVRQVLRDITTDETELSVLEQRIADSRFEPDRD